MSENLIPSDETDEPSKIAVFRPASDFPVHKRNKASCRCSKIGSSHPWGPSPAVWVDEYTRAVECKKCGARMEAFDYLYALAIDGQAVFSSLHNMREEKQALKAQITLLNEQIKELKAQQRKAAKQ